MVRMLSTFSLAALLGGAGGDRAVARARASPPGVAMPAAAALPRFALFGWVSPPNESTSAARIAELAGAGLNVALPAWADSGRLSDNLRRLRYAADHGVRCLAWDERFARVYNQGAAMAMVDTIVADYAGEPGFLGYYFTDEPAPDEFPLLARIYADLAARDPVHPAWNDLRGLYGFGNRGAWEVYARSFIEPVPPSVLVDNQYDFLIGGDRRQFIENAAAMRALADEYGIPFWVVVLLVQHGGYRGIGDGELRWQVSHLLAYGARGIGFFTY